MAEKTKLSKTRAIYRGQITKLQNKIRDILETAELNVDDHDALIAALGTYTDKLAVICDLDKQLLDLLVEDELDHFLVESDDYTSSAKEQHVKYERQVSRRFTVLTDTNVEVTSTDITQQRTHSSNRTRNINLPKLSLKHFDGNILEWQEFNDTFSSAIDTDVNLTNVQKFQYLRAQVTGEAARAINGLSLTDGNYTHAMALLKNRYGQTHKIISAYMRALWELHKPEYSIDSLRDFNDRLETYIRGLSTLGKTEESYGDLLVPVVLDKLPPAIRKQMARDHGNNEWDIKDLRASLQKEIDAMQAGDVSGTLEYGEATPYTAAFYTRTSQFSRQLEPRDRRTSTFAKPRLLTCAFCKGKHLSGDCNVISDKKKRHEVVVRDRLCFNCLGKHRAVECQSKNRCRICQRKHHTSLCNGTKPDNTTATLINSDTGIQNTVPDETTVSLANLSGPVLLKTAIGNISSSHETIKVAILFDEGAQRSFITQEVADMLDIKCPETETVKISAFGGNTGQRHLPVANFMLQTTDSSNDVSIRALVVPQISTPIRNYIQPSVLGLPYLQGLKLAHPYTHSDTEIISVLIGADYYWSIVRDRIVRGPGPTAVSSKLGYLLSGPTSSSGNESTSNHSVCHVNIDINSHRDEEICLQRFWDLETIGVKQSELDPVISHTEYRKTHIRNEQGRYIAKLPWKDDHAPLPINQQVAEARTRAMVRRLSPDLRETYDNIIKQQLSDDYIETLQNDDKTCGHYLPHRAVKKDSASTPIRIVYDCSCSTGTSPSLNDCLQTGPPLLNDLAAILLRFRVHKIAISSDIQKAFLQIRLDKDDRKYTKFFWLSDSCDPESDFDVYQFKVVLFGAVCSPFILNATVRNHLETYQSDTAHDLANNIYVDNVVSGCNSGWDAITYYDEANDIMLGGGFQLRSWSTNCPELREYAKPDISFDPKREVNVLGIKWDTETDCISYRNSVVVTDDDDIVTKRMVVKTSASIYDPLGYLAPVHVRAKLFIQELWKAGYDWDQPISLDLVHKWHDIVNDLSSMTSVTLKRRYFKHDLAQDSMYELHAFADASKVAYGCVVYLRDVRREEASIIMSKSRVAPIKELTIPQLELLAALIASNLLDYVTKSIAPLITISKRVLWSDSQIVLHWLNSDKKLPIFVTNRLKSIKSKSIDEFKFCPTGDNPADLVSRGLTSSDLSQSQIWWIGPTWLGQGDWPVCHLFDSAVLTTNADPECQPTLHPSQQDDNVDDNSCPISLTKVITLENYSSLSKLCRVTAYVLRFMRLLKNKQRATTSSLSVSEVNAAENTLLKHVQQAYYSREIEDIAGKKPKNRNTLVRQLRLFRDDNGILRVGGRLHNAPIQYDAKFPILLPSNSHYTKLIIQDAHDRILHAGPESTMTFLRQTFWITKMRQTVKSILRNCVKCKLVTGLPFKLPESAPLQSFRLQKSPPFTICGLDYTGALYVKSGITGKHEDKAYILLFTCANTRAVHLETVSNLSTSAFLHAFRRFAARRSLPSKLISDNASTFLSAGEEIKKLFCSGEIKQYMVNNKVEWSFITKRAPWHGGFWEKLIGLTKTILKKVLGRAFVTIEELTTIVTEIETVLNNRPLTYYSSDINDPTPLTPSHLLHGRVLTNLPHMFITDEEINDPTFGDSQSELEKRAKRLSMLQTHFINRWSREYITALRERHISSRKGHSFNTDNVINVGDIVLVHDDNHTRIKWKLAMVTELIYGNDNLVRSAKIRMDKGVTNRPINKLYPLEVSAVVAPDTNYVTTDVTMDTNLDCHNPVPNTRPSRDAALIAKEKIKIISSSYDY